MAIKTFVKCCDCGEMIPTRNAWSVYIDVLRTSYLDDTNMFPVCKNCADKLRAYIKRSDEDANKTSEEENN